jgi:hypothetical protein
MYVMMKKLLACYFLIFISVNLSAQLNVAEIDSALLPVAGGAHYMPEYDLDKPVDTIAWEKQSEGMHVAFGAEDVLYFRTEVPQVSETTWQATGWRGERLNTQIITWSPDTTLQVRFQLHDLKNEKGDVLAKENIQLYKVCYVLANYPYGARNAVCGETPYKNGYLMPDRFESFDRFDILPETVRPVWLSCNIPADAAAGNYTGIIDVISAHAHTSLQIKIKVQQQTLPAPHNWQYRLDLWQNPWVIADYFHVKPWSDAHKDLLKQHLKLYADAGGTYITTYGVHSPWGDNEYHIEQGMIKWIKQKNGAWKFDYSIFDEYVELAMSMGIDKAITIYTPLPWGERFRYFDEASGNYIYEQWMPESSAYKNNWDAFLTSLMQHLKNKGWFNKTYLGINENEMQQTLAAIKIIKAHSPKWKITYAGNWHPELDSLLDDYCFLHGNEASKEQVEARTARNKTTTFYVCCNPSYPNNFLFSPPVEGRWMSWYAAAHGYNGFLRWAYDAWPEDPLRDARYGSWPAGDCFLVYPGGNSCIRFEKLREGIVDYEKIKIITALAAKTNNGEIKKLIGTFNTQLQTLNAEKTFNEDKLKADITQGKQLIDLLSDKLAAQGFINKK